MFDQAAWPSLLNNFLRRPFINIDVVGADIEDPLRVYICGVIQKRLAHWRACQSEASKIVAMERVVPLVLAGALTSQDAELWDWFCADCIARRDYRPLRRALLTAVQEGAFYEAAWGLWRALSDQGQARLEFELDKARDSRGSMP